MSEIIAVFYGLIQGMTEFLPVSSSGHLALFPKFMNFKDPGVAFDLAMHVGTAFSIMFYFKKDIVDLFQGLISRSKEPELLASKAFAVNLIIATICSVLVVLLIKDYAEFYGRSSKFIAFNLIFFGVLLYISDRFSKQDEAFSKEIVTKNKPIFSILMGFFQAIAVFPGVSRSGITITMARFSGVSREAGARYSFLLSLPLIFGGFIYKLLSEGEDFQFDTNYLFIGLFSSFFSGLIAIHFFLKIFKKIGVFWFSIYRIALGLLVLML
ncbi:MAG: undecaprenyl-diphosphate phosphatase [Bacteriovoracaceae bacterium]